MGRASRRRAERRARKGLPPEGETRAETLTKERWAQVIDTVPFDEIVEAFNDQAHTQGDWAGVPVPLGDTKVVVANDRQKIAMVWPPQLPDARWRQSSRISKAFNVYRWREDGSDKTEAWCENYWGLRIQTMFETMSARRAVLPKAELIAFRKVLEYVDEMQGRDYLLSNAFGERGRSGVLYVFRRGLPVLTFSTRGPTAEPLAALCLHPLAYYAHTHAGAMAPSDEVIALLLMMRADERYLWRKANQMDVRDPMVAL